MGSDGKQRGLKALGVVHPVEIDWGHKALNAYALRWVIMGTMP